MPSGAAACARVTSDQWRVHIHLEATGEKARARVSSRRAARSASGVASAANAVAAAAASGMAGVAGVAGVAGELLRARGVGDAASPPSEAPVPPPPPPSQSAIASHAFTAGTQTRSTLPPRHAATSVAQDTGALAVPDSVRC